MARFSDLLKGKRARRTVEFPQANTRCSLLAPLPELEQQRAADNTSAPEATPTVLVDLVVLTGDEEAQALEQARAMAIRAGVADPKLGEPLYDLALMVFTLLYGVIDHDDQAAQRQFFASGEQIRGALDRDRITYLYAMHELWQSECSPQAKGLSDGQFFQFIVEMADSEDPSLPFGKLQPATAAIYMRTLARLLVNSQTLKSSPTSTSEADTATDTKNEQSDNVH
jgi:hypothetical protein